FFTDAVAAEIHSLSLHDALPILLTGVTFSAILLAYSAATLVTTFGVTAGTFGVMSAVGYFTKKDLTSFGRLMMMGLIGIILASLDRKSTRLNSSHVKISYAVFCL